MAPRTKRRSTRNAAKGSPEPEPTPNGEEPSATPPGSQASAELQPAGTQERDRCPACKEGEETEGWNETDKESWVRCDACKKWFHWRCAGEGELEVIDKWYAYILHVEETREFQSEVDYLQVLCAL